jgi:hypothetical protein
MDPELEGVCGAPQRQGTRVGEMQGEYPVSLCRRVLLKGPGEDFMSKENLMSAKTTTIKALIEAVQDVSANDDEAVAVLEHLLKTRRVVAQRPRGASQVANAYF